MRDLPQGSAVPQASAPLYQSKADPHLRSARRKLLAGEVPSPVNPPSGCCFHTRCPYATERCRTEKPELKAYGDRMAACHRIGEAFMADL